MQGRSDDSFPAALLRMLEARIAAPAIGIFSLRSGVFRPWAFNSAMRGMWPDQPDASARPVPPELARALAAWAPARLDARALGLSGEFAAVVPVRGAGGAAGFLSALDPRARRLTPGIAAALADGAALLAPLLAAAPERMPQRRAPRAVAQDMLEAALRASGPRPLALMILDLERFRAVNAALGTAAGDALLAVTAARLEHALGPADRLVRLEGDRFVVLAARDRVELRPFAQRLLDIVGRPLDLAGHPVRMQASIGIVAGVSAELPIATLLHQADIALRRAKAEGRDRIALHEPRLAALALEKSRLELDLAQAPGNGQMHLLYQPYVELDTGTVSGVEALLRWRHPVRGELQPAAFIPLAEATGLILPIGAWALRTALAEAGRWPTRLMLSVNISALQFHQPGFTAEVEAALLASGFPPRRLELEITETVLMRDNPATIRQLTTLIDRGIRIALDDFGTGYSALAYLARLPHHRIKLDKAFVQDLANPATAELIRAIIALARAQGVAVTAEGVERPDLLAEVRRMGFTHAQGFATGLPVADPMALFAEAPEAAEAPLA